MEIDPGIKKAVEILRAGGVETFESCEGGEGHAFFEPTIRFHGNKAEGMRALSVVMNADLPVAELHRQWSIQDGEIVGPWWELTFIPTKGAT